MTLLPRILVTVLLILLTGVAALTGAHGAYQAKGKRDPLVALLTPKGQRIQPPGLDEEAETGVQQLVLQGVVFDPEADSFAIINGQIVKPHDQMEGIEVVEIEPGRVILQSKGQRYDLRFPQPTEDREAP